MYANLKFNPKCLKDGISCWYGPTIWSGKKAEIRSLVREVEISKMWTVVVIVSEFSAWLVLGSEYLIDVKSEGAVAFVFIQIT